MIAVYDLFRDFVTWTQPGGDPEYPGHKPEGPKEVIDVRALGVSMVEIGGDTVQRRVWWTLPEHAVRPGHTLDGYAVTEVAGEVKDRYGNLLYRVVYGAV